MSSAGIGRPGGVVVTFWIETGRSRGDIVADNHCELARQRRRLHRRRHPLERQIEGCAPGDGQEPEVIRDVMTIAERHEVPHLVGSALTRFNRSSQHAVVSWSVVDLPKLRLVSSIRESFAGGC